MANCKHGTNKAMDKLCTKCSGQYLCANEDCKHLNAQHDPSDGVCSVDTCGCSEWSKGEPVQEEKEKEPEPKQVMKEKQNMAENTGKVKKTKVQKAKAELSEAAWNVFVTTSMKGSKEGAIGLLRRGLPAVDEGVRTKFAEVLEGPLGDVIWALIMSGGINYGGALAAKYVGGENLEERLEFFSSKMRVMALSSTGQSVADAVVMPLITDIVKPMLQGMPALPDEPKAITGSSRVRTETRHREKETVGE